MKSIEKIISVVVILIFSSCHKEMIPQMSHNNIKKSLRYSSRYHFDSFNTPSTYALNLDSLESIKRSNGSLCKLIERDLGYIQEFYASQFDFDTEFPLEKKSDFCGLDTCNVVPCGYSITYYSKFFSIDKQAAQAKPIPKQLFLADKYFRTKSYYGLMLRIDVGVSTTKIANVTVAELDVSTEIIWRQRSESDTEGWEAINRSKQVDEDEYLRFKKKYQSSLSEFLDKVLAGKGYLIKTK